MEYTKLNCTITPDNEITRSMLIEALGDIGFESFVEIDESIEAYIPSKNFSIPELTNDTFQNNRFFSLIYSVEQIADQNWNEVWEKNYFQPLLIENCCVIRAPFHTEYPEAPIEIIIHPKMAFGTGNHETTHLMIKAILKMDLSGKIVLDMGCGSGILSILASIKGAKNLTSIDIDEWSVNNTTENCGLNNITNVTVKLGDASLLKEDYYDLILANIQRNILLRDMREYCAVLNKGGEIIFSGFYTNDLTSISDMAESLGLKFESSECMEDWCAARFMLA